MDFLKRSVPTIMLSSLKGISEALDRDCNDDSNFLTYFSNAFYNVLHFELAKKMAFIGVVG